MTDFPIVRPGGRLFALDQDGALRNETDRGLLPRCLEPVVEAAIDLYRAVLGRRLRGVYIRGSAVRGTFVDGVSDLDTWAVCDGPDDGPRLVVEPYREASKALEVQFGLEVELTHSHRVRLDRPDASFARMMLATQACLVHGKDDRAAFGRFWPGVDTNGELRHVRASLSELAEGKHYTVAACRWIGKSLVRAGLEVTATRHGQYTRDLWPCYALFSAFHPEASASMLRALELAVQPTDDPGVLQREWARFLRDLAPLLVEANAEAG